MKPLGLTLFMQVVHPTRAEDKVWEAVQEAICAGWTPVRFMREAREAWHAAKEDEVKADDSAFTRKEEW